MAQATVELLTLGCDLSLGQGTGVAVGSGQVLTNRHVVAGFRTLDVVVDDRPPNAIPAASVSVAADVDVATIRTAGLPVAPLAVAPYDPRPDERVSVAGFPSAPHGTSTGLVVFASRVLGYGRSAALGQHSTVMLVRGAVRLGMSGGPVLDQAGRLAGLVYGIDTATGDTLAIPASVLRTRSRRAVRHPSC